MNPPEERTLALLVGPRSFLGVDWNPGKRSLDFSWLADTEAPNVAYFQLLRVGLCWPPVQRRETIIY
jgi:hypothetical protein